MWAGPMRFAGLLRGGTLFPMPTPDFIRSLRAKIGHDLLHLPTVAVLVYDKAGRVLLVKEIQSQLWTCPGGIVEPDELPANAALRETWEEAGVHAELSHLVGVVAGAHCTTVYANGDRIAWVATVFAARALTDAPRGDGDETTHAAFFTEEEVSALPSRPLLRDFLDAARVARPGAYFAPATWRPQRATR
jgi:ADP-ribose pyrophosphatase YjhB (NUDIX family)